MIASVVIGQKDCGKIEERVFCEGADGGVASLKLTFSSMWHFFWGGGFLQKNQNTWLWSRLAFVELHSEENNPANKLVKHKKIRTLNYRNKCDVLYFCKKTYFLFDVFNTFSKLLSACVADVI